jgi:hypothetical protein
MHMIKKLFLFFFLFPLVLTAQIDYNKQYFNAKDHFRLGKYNLAMEAFKPLIAYDQRNPYSPYASFFYALSAYKQNYKAVAKDMLNQIKSLYPTWDKIDEVNFWLGKIHFDNADYFQGMKVFSAIRDKKFENDIATAKAPIAKIPDAETLRMMLEEYPKDALIAKALVNLLSKNISSPEDQKQLEDLIDKFGFKRTDFIPEAPKTFYKDRYAVSVLLPFMVNSLEPTPSKKRNQILLDFYEGLKLAADTLETHGVNISLRAYDTERNLEKIKRLLGTEELKNTDLIIGPFFPEENKVVQDFSLENRINVIHPFSNNSEIIGNNPHAYLFQPSSETLGRKSAEHLASRVTRKNCMVFYGPNKKDSVLAANFVKTATEKGLNVVLSQKLQSREGGKILEILATPTEYDEFKYPSQFTLKKDSIGSIYVASDDALIYAKVITTVETRGDSIKVVGSENWLDDTAIDPEKYQTLHIALTAPNYADPSRQAYRQFFTRFIRRHGRAPSSFAAMGYELMLFFGNQLKKNGVFFQDGLSKTGPLPGYIFEGYNYQYTRDNALVPFISVQKGQLSLLEKR